MITSTLSLRKGITRSAVLSLLVATTCLVSPIMAQGTLGTEGLVDETTFDRSIQGPDRPQVGIAPLASRLSLNGTQLEFGEEVVLDLPFEGGEGRNFTLGGDLNYIFDTEINQNLAADNGGSRIETSQRAWVFQLRAIDRQRTITRTIEETGDLLGFKLDFSVTGQCFLGENGNNDYCTYTPGLSTVPGAYDADTLAPTAFRGTTNFGEVIPFALHEDIKGEGFRRGEAIDPEGLVGLSFDVPNAGFLVNEGNGAQATGSRDEDIKKRLVPSLARIDQSLFSNNVKAAATRTTRAFVLPDRDEADSAYALMQLAAWVLPAASPTVAFTDGSPNSNVSNNIFYALSNARVPADSFTMFQTGRAEVVHGRAPAQSAAETPVAKYFGVWMGLSPVRDVRQDTRVQFMPTGARESINAPIFRQGGIGTPFEDLVDVGVTLFDQIDQSITDINFQNIDDLFIQVGLDVSTQNAVRRVTSREVTDYRLVPHLSFSGNQTGGEQVLRYYTGVIFSDDNNVYVGADYSLATESGWNAYARADFYSEPDQDYFSEAELRGSRTFTLNPTRQLTFGAGAVVALDNLDTDDNRFGFADNDTRADLVGRWREGPMDMTVRQRYTRDDDNDDWRDSTTFGVAYATGEQLSVTAQVTPISSELSYIEGAIGMNLRLDDDPNAPVFQAQYARARYDLGATGTGDRLSTTDNIFQAGFQVRF